MKALGQHQPELVITDIIMPEQEGLETIMMMKKRRPGVRIIAISGGGQGGMDEYLHMAQLLGAERVMAKPFRLKEIVAAVEQLLAEPAD